MSMPYNRSGSRRRGGPASPKPRFDTDKNLAKSQWPLHLNECAPPSANIDQQILVAAEPIWSSSNSAVKISILHLYIEIFITKIFRRLCYLLMALTICFNTVVVLEAFLLCRPFAYNWDLAVAGSCADTNKAWLSAGIINLLIDVCIIYMPLPLLWKLQMPVMKKIGITAMFGVGAVYAILRTSDDGCRENIY